MRILKPSLLRFIQVTILVLFDFFVNEGYATCLGASYARQIGFRLKCGIFQTMSIINWVDCQKMCTSTISCFSINVYQPFPGMSTEYSCEMIAGNIDSFKNQSCLELGAVGKEYHELRKITTHCSDDGVCKKSTEEYRGVLPDGWYQLGSSAFKYFKTKKTWKDANDTCSADKASLATIDSELENSFITKVFFQKSGSSLGIKVKVGKHANVNIAINATIVGAWVGPTHSYVNWAPALQSASSSCVLLIDNAPYYQDKVSCDKEMEYICEKRLE